MTEELKARIVSDMSEMVRLTEQYNAATNEIIHTDIDETLEEIVSRRAAVITDMGKVRKDIDDACELCSKDENDLIHRMIKGGHVPLGLSPELREIHKIAVKLHSVYISVTEKEKQAAARVDARVKELRTELENVNTERKKTAGYTAAGSGLGSSGSTFDGRL